MPRETSATLVVFAVLILLVGTFSSQFPPGPLHGRIQADGGSRILSVSFTSDGPTENFGRGWASELSDERLSDGIDAFLEGEILWNGLDLDDTVIVYSEVIGEVRILQSGSGPIELEPQKQIRVIVNPDGSITLQIIHLSQLPLAENQPDNAMIPIEW